MADAVLSMPIAGGLRHDTDRGGPPPSVGLRRDRLTRELDRIPTARLGLVIAPAGSGKTTLLADWALGSGGAVAWHAAAESDSEGLLVASLGQRWGLPAGSLDGMDALVARLHGQPETRLLVIDNYHLLPESARGAIDALLSQAPPDTSVVIGSRDPACLRVLRGEVAVNPVVLGPKDLAFRSWEVEALFREVFGIPLLPEHAEKLTQCTGGWAAALLDYHLSARDTTPRDRHRSIQSLWRRTRHARPALSREVLDDLPSDYRQFLRRTAPLPLASGPRCDILLDRQGSHQILADLAAQGRMVWTDDQGRTFRYSEVLRRHLEAEWESEIGERGILGWYRWVADTLDEEGARGEALQVLVRCEDWSAVERTLRRSGPEIASEVAWAQSIPDHLAASLPWVDVARARLLLRDGQLDAAGAMARGTGRRLPSDQRREMESVLEAAQVWGVVESPPSSTQWHGRVAAGLRRLETSTSPFDASLEAQIAQPFLLLLRGDARSALTAAQRACANVPERSPAALALGIVVAIAACLEGDPHALRIAECVAAHADNSSDVGWLKRASQALVAAMDPDYERGLATRRRIIDLCESRHDHWGSAWAAGLGGIRELRRPAPDVETLDQAAVRFQAVGAWVPASWMEACAALVLARQGAHDSAARARNSIVHAKEAGCDGAVATATAALAFSMRDRLLLAEAKALADQSDVTFRPWHTDLLPEPRAAARPSLAIRLLGDFELAVRDEAVDVSDLRPQTRQLLHILALNAGDAIHRERLCELMWPSQPPRATVHRLQVTLSTLRRALSRCGQISDDSLIQREGNAYRLRLPHDSQVDIVAFRAALDRARAARRTGDLGTLVHALGTAVDLYSGELLPEEGPAEWVVASRERLRSDASAAAVELSEALAGTDPRAAAMAAERAIEIDGYNDHAWRRLIELLFSVGDVANGARAEQGYANVLRELGVDDIRTSNAQRRLRNSPSATARLRPAPAP